MGIPKITKRTVHRFFSRKKYLEKNFLIWLFLLVFVFLSVGIYQFLLLPRISLKGQKTVVLDYPNAYVEKGYNASFLGDDITDEVMVSGEVDGESLGVYNITYDVSVGMFHKRVVRKVEVRDRKKPVIEMDNSALYLCPGSDFVPEKVVATDNYDGDLSDQVESFLSRDKSQVTYKVSDSSGNTMEITKKIFYKDIEKPRILLNGYENVTLYVGDSYMDAGVVVEDNCGDDLNRQVKTEGSVDTNVVGDYTITYRVKDYSLNEAVATRTVYVRNRGANGTIYLTFDDGPNSGTTDVILDILKEEGVKATFFVTNRGPDSLILREYQEGHTVGLHTATHDYSIVYSSYDAYFHDLYQVQNRVKNITGYESKIIRFPGGSSNTISRKYAEGIMSYLTEEVQKRGFRYYDWNLSSGDAGATTDPEGVYQNVVSALRKDRVNMVLMHDIKPYTRDALRKIIQYGKENGYTFDRITMDTEMIRQRVNN